MLQAWQNMNKSDILKQPLPEKNRLPERFKDTWLGMKFVSNAFADLQSWLESVSVQPETTV